MKVIRERAVTLMVFKLILLATTSCANVHGYSIYRLINRQSETRPGIDPVHQSQDISVAGDSDEREAEKRMVAIPGDAMCAADGAHPRTAFQKISDIDVSGSFARVSSSFFSYYKKRVSE